MNEPVTERKISQFLEGSLKRKFGSPTNSQHFAVSKSWHNSPIILNAGFPFGGGEGSLALASGAGALPASGSGVLLLILTIVDDALDDYPAAYTVT